MTTPRCARQIAMLQQRATALEAEIAQRKDTERRLQVAKAEAEAANRIKDAFLAVLSHQWLGPDDMMALVRHLVEVHGGTVSAGRPGRRSGATFTVTLPLIQR